MANIKDNDKAYIANTYARFDLNIVSGKGSLCYDENGAEYIDLGAGIGVNSLGYCNKDWVEAVSKQAATLQHTSNLYYTSPAVEVAKKLCGMTGYQRVFFSNSGAEANECAIKTARKYSFDRYNQSRTRNKILSLENSFHGRTITTLSATGQEVFHNYFFPFNDGFDFVLANDIQDLHSKLDEDVCGIIVEFVQGEGGVIPLDKAFVDEIKKVCSERDILLIADEVQTGIGRTGKLLACEHYGVTPDIVSLAKGLGGGLPIGATLFNDKTKDVLSYSDHGTTYGANPVACAGAKVVLDYLDDSFLQEVCGKADYIRKRLASCSGVSAVDGLGLMLGISLTKKSAREVVVAAIQNGIIPLTAKDKVRLLPPLTISYDELDKALEILIKVIDSD